MALKNLVAQKAALTEEAIESIVSEYVRFDTDEMDIAFTPEFASLHNKSKILVYLVALQGWPFVTDEAVATAAKPAVIGDDLGIPGGSLRPMLKELKDGHLITVKNGAYSVRASHLQSVKSEISGRSSVASPKKKTKKVSKKASKQKKKTAKVAEGVSKRKNSGLADTIGEWIESGFFDDGRTTADVRDRFHEEAVLVPVTSIPGYVNKAVRQKLLTRKKEDVDGRQVWVYRTKQ